jgi:hypothetical protein
MAVTVDPAALTDSGNGLGGFKPHDNLTLNGCTTSANDASMEMLTVAAGTITFPAGSIDSGESLLTSTILASCRGGSVSDLFRNGYLQVYGSAAQPSSADTAAPGTLLITYTLSDGAFEAGTETNGINFDEVSSGVVSKDASEDWQGTAVATGVAQYFRFMSNSSTPSGTGTDQIRFDGSVASSGADLNMPTSISSGTKYTIDTFTVTIPAT